MLELKDITKKFDQKTAIDSISLKVEKGNIVGLLGPNGAGKTTTMRIITGFLIPDEGEIFYNGKNVDVSDNEYRKMIGYMPENNPLPKEMTIEEYLDYSSEIRDLRDELKLERIKFAVKSTGLEDYYFYEIGALSKGLKQRVGIAQVLLSDPEIMVLDEPTEGLDPKQRIEIRELIKKLAKNKTIIISTHVMQEVEFMCNKIIIINKGQIVIDGDRDSVLNRKGNVGNIEIRFRSKNKVGIENFTPFEKNEVTLNKTSQNEFFAILKTKNEDPFKIISDIVKKNEWILTELKTQRSTLENIFTDLTQ